MQFIPVKVLAERNAVTVSNDYGFFKDMQPVYTRRGLFAPLGNRLKTDEDN